MSKFEIRMISVDCRRCQKEDRDGPLTATVDAAYHVLEDGFLTFKDDQHQQVATYNSDYIKSITRVGSSAQRPVIGDIRITNGPVDTTRASAPSSTRFHQ